MHAALRPGYERPATRRRRTAPAHLLVLLLLSALLASGPARASDEWPGWRGLERQGCAVGPAGPLRWSPTSGIVWRTPIPGEGHSSPIVSGDAVYVTTAWMVPVSRPLLAASRIVQGAALALVIVLALWMIGWSATRAGVDARSLVRLGGHAALLALLALLVLFGEGLLDFGRGDERAWIAACLVGTVASALATAVSRPGGRWRSLGGLFLLAFAGLMAVLVPGKQRTIAADPTSEASMVVYAVLALPVLLGISQTGAGLRALSADQSDRTARVLDIVGEALGVLARVGLGLLLGALWRLVVSQRHVSTASVSTTTMHSAVTSWWWLLVPAAVLVALLLLRPTTKRLKWVGLAIVVASAVLAAAAAVVGVDHLLTRERYMWYLVGTARFEPALGWRAVWVLAGLAAAAFAALVLLWRGRSPSTAFRAGLAGAAGLLVTLHLVYALFQPKAPHMERAIVSVDRDTGAIRWISHGLLGDRGTLGSGNSPATPTPVTDGERIYAYFGTPGLLCADNRGRVLWRCMELPFESQEGVATSPILCDGRAIILSESDAGRYLAAVESRTGRLAWRTQRRKPIHPYAGNCRTPSVFTVGGKRTIVVWGMEEISGYDPRTGRELWSRPIESIGTSDNPVGSVVEDAGLLYLLSQRKATCLDAAMLPGQGDPVVWESPITDGPQCASPLVKDGLLLAVSDGGTVQCLDAQTGRQLWRRKLGWQHYASPVVINGLLYLCDTKGRATVVALAPEYREVAVNDLGQGVYASPAPVDGSLYVRSFTHLYRIGRR